MLQQLKELRGTVLILTHHNADVDALASALALQALLRKIGHEADIGVAESISRVAQKLAQGKKVIIDPDCAKYDNVILVDTSVPEQLSGVANLRADFIIDHHPRGRLAERARAVWIDENSRSTAQMIYALYKELGLEPEPDIARAIAGGIVADTAHLRLARLREFEVLVELLRYVEFQSVLKLLETAPDISERVAVLKAASRAQYWKIGDLILAISKISSHEAAAARALLKIGADIAVVAAEKEDQVRISSRGKSWILERGIDLSVIFWEVGRIIGGSGGGHNLAGSANGPRKKQLPRAIKFIISELEKALSARAKRLD